MADARSGRAVLRAIAEWIPAAVSVVLLGAGMGIGLYPDGCGTPWFPAGGETPDIAGPNGPLVQPCADRTVPIAALATALALAGAALTVVTVLWALRRRYRREWRG